MTLQNQGKKFIFFPKNCKNGFHICIATEGIFYHRKSQRPLKYRGCSQLSNKVHYYSLRPLQEALEQKEIGPISLTHAVVRLPPKPKVKNQCSVL